MHRFLKRFLAVARRLFLTGTVSLIAILVLRLIGNPGITFQYSDIFGRYFLLFTLASPIIYLLLWVGSTAYNRKFGHTSMLTDQIKFIGTLLSMLKSDFTSPFRLIWEQFKFRKQLVDYYSYIASDEVAEMLADGSIAINRLRLLRTIIMFAVCILGVLATVALLKSGVSVMQIINSFSQK